jgi:hypothetical protein
VLLPQVQAYDLSSVLKRPRHAAILKESRKGKLNLGADAKSKAKVKRRIKDAASLNISQHPRHKGPGIGEMQEDMTVQESEKKHSKS